MTDASCQYCPRCGFMPDRGFRCPNCDADIQAEAYGEGFTDAYEGASKRVDPLMKALRQIAEITCDHPSGVPCHRDIARAAIAKEEQAYPEKLNRVRLSGSRGESLRWT